MQHKTLLTGVLFAVVTAGSAAAQNDECTGALTLVVGSNPYDTTGATTSSPWPCALGGSDLWYTYTPTFNADLTVDTCTNPTYDTALQVFSGTCGSLTSILCNDDFCGLQSSVNWLGTGGTTYYIRVGGFNSQSGVGEMTLTEIFVPDVNDECSGALPLALGPNAFSTLNAMSSPEAWPCATGGADLWYSYTAASTDLTFAETCGANYDSALQVFDGSNCALLTSLQCNDDACSLQSRVTWAATAGTTYLIRVGGFASATGSGDLTVGTIAPPPPNCLQTTFVSNNGGSVGGNVFFDLTTTQDITISALDTNYSAVAGNPVGMMVYLTPGTFVGAEQNIALWNLVATDDGRATSSGTGVPTRIRFSTPIVLPAGSYGVALRAVGSGHRYVNGTGPNQLAQTPDGVLSFVGGKAQNTPFSSTPFSPRIWNGRMCYNVPISTSYCPAVINSTGVGATISAVGSDDVSDNSVVLSITDMPMQTFILLLTSPTQGFWMNPGGSGGNLCLGGSIGRAVGNQIYTATNGSLSNVAVDLAFLPTPILVFIAAQAGESWNFQAWFRDPAGMSVGRSNFTNGIEIQFQ